MSKKLIFNEEVHVYLRPPRSENSGHHDSSNKPSGQLCSGHTRSDVNNGCYNSSHSVADQSCSETKTAGKCSHLPEEHCCSCPHEAHCCHHAGDTQLCKPETSPQCEHADKNKRHYFQNEVHTSHVGDKRLRNVHNEDMCCSFVKDLCYNYPPLEQQCCHVNETHRCTLQDEHNYQHVATCCTDAEHVCNDGKIQHCEEQNGRYCHHFDIRECCSCCHAEEICNVADKVCCIFENSEFCNHINQQKCCGLNHIENNNCHFDDYCCRNEHKPGGYLSKEHCSCCVAGDERNGLFSGKKTNYCCNCKEKRINSVRERNERRHFVRKHSGGHFVCGPKCRHLAEESRGRREREGRSGGRRRNVGVKLYFKEMSAAVRQLRSLVKRRDAMATWQRDVKP